MKSKIAVLLIGSVIFSMQAIAKEDLPPLPKGPLLLTSTAPEQLNPDYWVNRLPDPDRILKTPEELEILNENTHAMVRDQIDVFRMPLKKDGRSIRELLELQYNIIKGRILFAADDSYIPKSLFEQEIKPVMQWEKVASQIQLRLAAQTDITHVVWLPKRGANGKVNFEKGYINRKSNVSEGYLPFTQRSIIRLAFKMLGARYGWGGTYNGRDCSGFTQDVYLTVGVDMPRGSKEQGFTGTPLGWFEYKEDAQAKLEVLRSAIPDITILRMPKHLMLYLGQVGGQHYVIHSTWAERYSITSDAKNRINQVVVSDLTLNGQSYLGSLFDRIISMNEID